MIPARSNAILLRTPVAAAAKSDARSKDDAAGAGVLWRFLTEGLGTDQGQSYPDYLQADLDGCTIATAWTTRA
jgi:hypothetical protein